MITVLVAPAELEQPHLELSGETYHHLFHARRLPAGEELRLVDGRGRARQGVIATVGKRSAKVELGAPLPGHEPAGDLQLLVAALRPQRASWLVEKATELGVTAIRFLNTERAPRHYGDGSLDRLQRVAAAAVEQCHRARLPELTGMHPWTDLPALLAPYPQRWLLDPTATTPPQSATPTTSVTLAIGPEGGWAPQERQHLQDLGCTPCSLGPRVLRVETAALAAAALVLLR